jgi:hypothetical protein
MTVNNKNYIETEYCYECMHEFKAKDTPITAKCSHVFHNKCWFGECSSYECKRIITEKHCSIDNWRAVKSTAVVLAVVYAIQWLTTAKRS